MLTEADIDWEIIYWSYKIEAWDRDYKTANSEKQDGIKNLIMEGKRCIMTLKNIKIAQRKLDQCFCISIPKDILSQII